jgi:hypothetical protein
MGLIINIDEALKLRSDYNVLKEPLNQMLMDRQEAWEKENPIDLLFVRGTLSSFQETYTSSIGFAHAFTETADFTVGPIFNTAEGFSATYRTRTFQGGFIITQQALEDRQVGKIKDDANAFIKRWHGDVVEYAMKAIQGGFGTEVTWGSEANGGVSRIKLNSADTVDGTLDGAKNPLFSKAHTIVKRDGMTTDEFNAKKQSNIFHANITVGGDDPGQIAKLADFINQVISTIENYYDDNGKIAGVSGSKVIVTGNHPHLKAAINAALSMSMFGEMPNVAYNRATAAFTPYLNEITKGANGKGYGFFIVDKAYNAENHGPEFTERVPFTLDVHNLTRPSGIAHDGRQRFDINCASWRGITYCHIGEFGGTANAWDTASNFTTVDVAATLVKPVTIVGTVDTTA